MKELLITGGAGFIGSHTCLMLLQAGFNIIVFDNYSNSSAEAINRVFELSGSKSKQRLRVVEGDIRSPEDLGRAFKAANEGISAVIHFAGLKSVA